MTSGSVNVFCGESIPGEQDLFLNLFSDKEEK